MRTHVNDWMSELYCSVRYSMWNQDNNKRLQSKGKTQRVKNSKGNTQSWTHIIYNAIRQLSRPKCNNIWSLSINMLNTIFHLHPFFRFFDCTIYFFMEILQYFDWIRSVIIHIFEDHIRMQVSRVRLNSHHVHICQNTWQYSVSV